MIADVTTRFLCTFIIAVPLALGGCAINEAAKNQAAYHYQMGESFLAENNVAGALRELTEAEKITPDDPQLLNLLGLAYFRKNRYDLAEQKYLKAIELRPTYSEARNNLGVDYLELKRWKDAAAQFKLVLDDLFYRDPDSATINLGLAYLGSGDYSQALSLLRGEVAKNPSDPRGRLQLGRVYFAMDRTEMAIAEYKKALELNKSYASAHYHLALAQVKMKDTASARSAFREVIRIAPDSEMGQLSREYLDLLK